MPVLVAEDNPVFQSMLLSMLTKWGYAVTMAYDGNEAWRLLQPENAPRLAILDWMMPGIDGVELCRRVRAASREPYQYILLLTARTDSDDLVQGMEAGADDYITKPFNAHELRVRLRAGRRILDLQEELLAAREALRDQATHDGLTGLLNRTAILEILQVEAERAVRERRPLALLLLDLDRFKLVNDTHGHLAGDAVLREASRRMKQVCRRYDAIGRYGGEEFLAVLPGSGPEASQAQAERLRATMASMPFDADGVTLPVTCSIGVAWREHPALSHLDDFMREADEALYAAKHNGRNRVAAYDGQAKACPT
jgi:diguanylate cyclase (GGDEF)-like protein